MERFPRDRIKVSERSAAVSAFLRDHAGSYTHIHLACHGSGQLLGPTDAALYLADGPLSLDDLVELAPLRSRLVVVSACQTAVTSLWRGDGSEALSVAAVLLGMGSACVIASLWSVDDLATAILMTRLYEGMIERDLDPADALRAAQLWLREATDEDCQRFIDSYPALRAEQQRRGRTQTRGGRGDAGPYCHPYYWGAFIAMGL